MSEKIDEKYSNYIQRHIESFDVFGNKEKFKYLFAYRNSVYGFRILIEILRLNNQSLLGNENICTKEYLTKVMAPLASRATIINFINDQIAAGSLKTEISKLDKRVKVIQPSVDLINEFKVWIDISYQ
tara:strand:+ start:112 stop:495 length:384 start_codon:yes stop_codon:yes gene_type:complete